jgi:hypothetical protein
MLPEKKKIYLLEKTINDIYRENNTETTLELYMHALATADLPTLNTQTERKREKVY